MHEPKKRQGASYIHKSSLVALVSVREIISIVSMATFAICTKKQYKLGVDSIISHFNSLALKKLLSIALLTSFNKPASRFLQCLRG